MLFVFIVSILFIVGCDNISVIGDKDNDGDIVFCIVDNFFLEEFVLFEEFIDFNGLVDFGLLDELDLGGFILFLLCDVNGDGI